MEIQGNGYYASKSLVFNSTLAEPTPSEGRCQAEGGVIMV